MLTPEMKGVVEGLHGLYVQLTGCAVTYNPWRENEWLEWLRYRRHAPFTAADLRLVVAYRKRRIENGEITMASLKFSNLIAKPDAFEEDLGMEVHRRRAMAERGDVARENVLKATGRDSTAKNAENIEKDQDGDLEEKRKAAVAKALADLQAMKRSLE